MEAEGGGDGMLKARPYLSAQRSTLNHNVTVPSIRAEVLWLSDLVCVCV